MGQTTSRDTIPSETITPPRTIQTPGVPRRPKSTIPCPSSRLVPDEEYIHLPFRALVAVAKLQDPDGYHRLLYSGPTPPASAASIPDASKQRGTECVEIPKEKNSDFFRTPKPPRGEDFDIYEDTRCDHDCDRGALLLPCHDNSLDDKHALSPQNHGVAWGTWSPVSEGHLSDRECPVAPPPTPEHGVKMPTISVNPTLARCSSFVPSADAGPQGKTVEVQGPREGLRVAGHGNCVTPWDALQETGKSGCERHSWKSLVQLSEFRVARRREARKPLVAQTPQADHQLLEGANKSISEKENVERELFVPDAADEKARQNCLVGQQGSRSLRNSSRSLAKQRCPCA